MVRQIILAAIAMTLLAQIAGCHYYLNAVPRIVISSEPFQITETHNNGLPGAKP